MRRRAARIGLFALLAFASAAPVVLAAPPEVAPLVQTMSQSRERLRQHRAAEQRALAALSQAEQAARLAGELKDGAALAVAREAVSVARAALSGAQGAATREEQHLHRLMAAGRHSCSQWAAQAALDRRAIETLQHTRELTQKELDEWAKMNAAAQQEALEAVAGAVIGEYVADLQSVRDKVGALRAAAAVRAERAANAATKARHLREARRLEETLGQLKPLEKELLSKEWAKGVADTDKVWKLVRDTWYHEFRVARAQNEELRRTLEDPAFKEVFAGADDTSPGAEVMRTLVKQAAEEAGKFAAGAERYERWLGPQVRAADFTIKMAYASTKSLVSMARVLDASTLAGTEARAARSLQLQYQHTVDNVRRCRDAGLLPLDIARS